MRSDPPRGVLKAAALADVSDVPMGGRAKAAGEEEMFSRTRSRLRSSLTLRRVSEVLLCVGVRANLNFLDCSGFAKNSVHPAPRIQLVNRSRHEPNSSTRHHESNSIRNF